MIINDAALHVDMCALGMCMIALGPVSFSKVTPYGSHGSGRAVRVLNELCVNDQSSKVCLCSFSAGFAYFVFVSAPYPKFCFKSFCLLFVYRSVCEYLLLFESELLKRPLSRL